MESLKRFIQSVLVLQCLCDVQPFARIVTGLFSIIATVLDCNFSQRWRDINPVNRSLLVRPANLQHPAIRRNLKLEAAVGLPRSLEAQQLPLRGDVPQANRAVIRYAGQGAAIRAEGDSNPLSCVASQERNHFDREQVPNLDVTAFSRRG